MQAEEREENKGKYKDNVPYADYGGWHKNAKVDRCVYLSYIIPVTVVLSALFRSIYLCFCSKTSYLPACTCMLLMSTMIITQNLSFGFN